MFAGGALTSLLVTDGVAPSAPEPRAERLWTCQGASRCRGRFLVFVVADPDRQRVLHLAQILAEPLSRHLA
jgi:hypothetical protein